MLSMTAYPKDYVDACRERFERQLAAYRAVIKTAGSANPKLDASVATFAPQFFNHLVLALDMSFCHRARGQEGKDGNPLNEVRLLCGSILENDAVFRGEKSIRWKADQSVLGYDVGDEISLDDADFARLSDAFFAEIERTFT